MAKRITIRQLKKAIATSPHEIRNEANNFIVRGLAEYKRIAVQASPWRVGQSGGGIPKKSGNLKEKH